jgi:serine/threonine-protein kinase
MVDDPRDLTAPEDTVPSAPKRRSKISLTDYIVGNAIGAGGMGEVLLAHDPQIGRDVAIKHMRDPAPSDEAIKRFLREATIQARLDHPAIVPVHEIGYDADGRPYFIMKHLSGVTLAHKLEAGGPIQPLLRALIDVCFAIDLAHARRIVHRDLKPSNIMLGDYGEVYVLDWGVARVLGEHDPTPMPTPTEPTSGTRTGAVLGTPGYIAPEQMRDARSVAEKVDIYSLGAILFEILAGEPLHARDDVLASTLNRPVDSPAARRPSRQIPPELDAACVAALAEDPSARPTARELAERLQSYLDGDRDLEHRRKLAARQVAIATDALDAGHRDEGIFAAGRALALDPESLEASELVLSLIVEPPNPLPRELVQTLAAGELAINRERSRRSIMPALAIIVLVTPFVFTTTVTSWPELIGLYIAAAALATLAFLHWRFAWASPPMIFFGLNIAVVVLFSRLAGPLVLTPVLVCALSIVIASRARPWIVPAFAALSVLVPFALEWLGVVGRTLEVPQAHGHGLVFGSSVFANDSPPPVRILGVIGGTVALLVVVGMYTTTLARQRQAAQRALAIQTWTLQRLLPLRERASRTEPTGLHKRPALAR